MLIVHSDAHRQHSPGFYLVRGRVVSNLETPERADLLLAAAAAGGYPIEAPDDHGAEPRSQVHTARYLAFLESAWERWRALPNPGPEVVANLHPVSGQRAYPRAVVGQAGWHLADASCAIGPGTWHALEWAANTAAHAAVRVLDGAPAAYALVRPPGHHAAADCGAGFCFLNQTAIAARLLADRSRSRVAVLDIDLHHGNGTQAIFYDRPEVLTVSLHCDPAEFYPFYSGTAGELGEGAGAGANLNLPLPFGTGDAAYLPALDFALATIRAFGPAFLVVALGLDAAATDPFAAFKITSGGYDAIARRIAGLQLPTVLVQEGGYADVNLGRNLLAFLEGFAALHRP